MSNAGRSSIDAATHARAALEAPVRAATATPALEPRPESIERRISRLSERWKKLEQARQWFSRARNYYSSETREKQAIKDLAGLPFLVAKLLGVELKLIPLARLWKVQIEFLIRFYNDAAKAEAAADWAVADWKRALEIARSIEPSIRDAKASSRLPDESADVKHWNNFVQYGHGYRAGNIYGGLMPGTPIVLESTAHIQSLQEQFGGQVMAEAERLLGVYLALSAQAITLTQLRDAALQKLEKLKDSKNSITQIVGALSILGLALDSEQELGTTPETLGVNIAESLRSLNQDLVSPWLEAAEAVAQGRIVLIRQ